MKAFLTPLVQRLAGWTGVSTRRTHARGGCRILMLHGVGATGYTPAHLEALCRYLRRSFEVVSLADLIRRAKEGDGGTGREVAVTFDDGLANNVEVAYPILARHGVRAAFFVCPDLVDAGGWLWTHDVRARLSRLSEEARHDVARAVGLEAVGATARDVVEYMKRLDAASHAQGVDVVRAATSSFEATAEERAAYDLATWEGLRALDPTLVEVGAHGATHRCLTTLDDVTLAAELREGRERLETALERPAPHLCYPNGDVDARVRKAAALHYEAALGTVPGVVRAASDSFDLPRISADQPLWLVSWRMQRL